MVSQTQDASLP